MDRECDESQLIGGGVQPRPVSGIRPADFAQAKRAEHRRNACSSVPAPKTHIGRAAEIRHVAIFEVHIFDVAVVVAQIDDAG